MNTTPDNQTPKPVRWGTDEDWIEPAQKVPAVLLPFNVKTPAEFLGKYMASEKLEALAGAMFGLTDMGMPIPDWAKNASIQFWKNYITTMSTENWHSRFAALNQKVFASVGRTPPSPATGNGT